MGVEFGYYQREDIVPASLKLFNYFFCAIFRSFEALKQILNVFL